MDVQKIASIVSICVGVISILTWLGNIIRNGQVRTVIQHLWNQSRALFITSLFLIIAVLLLSAMLLNVLLSFPSSQGTSGPTHAIAATTVIAPLSSITHLMDQEVLAGKTGDVQIVESIYTQDAVVTDAGCYSHPGVLSYYNGLIEIINRYQHLPHFDALQHVNISVTWDPQQPMEAKATADTVGVTSAANGSKIPLVGHESWSFVGINNQWFISRFIFNLCLQS
jgi:hypothetical protein